MTPLRGLGPGPCGGPRLPCPAPSWQGSLPPAHGLTPRGDHPKVTPRGVEGLPASRSGALAICSSRGRRQKGLKWQRFGPSASWVPGRSGWGRGPPLPKFPLRCPSGSPTGANAREGFGMSAMLIIPVIL